MLSRFFSLLVLACVLCFSSQSSQAQEDVSPKHDNFYEELSRNFVPAPARKPVAQRQTRSLSWPELTENNAEQWGTFASDGAVTTLSNNTSKVKVGSASLLFTTKSAAYTGVRYPASGEAHLNLSNKARFVFWAYGYNTNSYGFQGNQPLVRLKCKGGTILYTPSSQVMSNDYWRFYSIPLKGSSSWIRTDTGTPDLSDLLSLEIEQDTWADSFSVYYDGVAFKDAPTTGGANVNPDVISPRILFICFDPIMENLGGVRQHETHGWMDPRILAQQTAEDLKRSSHGLYQPQIVKEEFLDEHPYFVDGFQHTDESFETAWNVPQEQRDLHASSVFDYVRFCREHNLVARAESGEFDEVWISSGPISGMWESTLVGTGGYWLNSPPVPVEGKRLFVIQGMGFERGVGEALHCFGHRAESIMMRCYGGWQNNQATNWNKFTLLDKFAPGLGGLGNVHLPVNALKDYDYDEPTVVTSNADDWLNYPNFQNTTRAFGSEEWSPTHRDPHRDYLNWWYSHMPHGSGVAPDGYLKSWWRYIADVDQFKSFDGNMADTEGLPYVSIESPGNGAAVSGTVKITAETLVDGAMGRVDFYVDGTFKASDTLAPYNFSWDTTGLSGVHRLEARAYELSAGNEAISTPVLVNVGDGPVPVLSVSNATLLEGNADTAQMSFTVTRTGDANVAASVAFATADDTAKEGSDYTATSGTLVFEPGQIERTINVPVAGDSQVEADETLFLKLSSPISALLGNVNGVGTIQNDDATISINDVKVTEGEQTAQATFTVTLSPALPSAVDVNYTTSTDEALPDSATANDDFTPVSGVLHFDPNQTSATVSVPIANDSIYEHDEQFFLDISGMTATKSRGVGTIQNDDAKPVISVKGPLSLLEGNSGTREVKFTVSLSSASKVAASVAYTTSSGKNNPATASEDFTPVSGTLTFAPGQVEQTIAVTVQGDTRVESNEMFSLDLSAPTEASLSATSSQANTTIQNDDTNVSINDVSAFEDTKAAASFTITLSPKVPVPVDVVYATAKSTEQNAATPGVDFTSVSNTVHFQPDQDSYTVGVPIRDDSTFEADEVFVLKIATASGSGANVVKSQGVGTIRNNDAAPNILLGVPRPVIEGNSGTTPVVFNIKLSSVSGLPVSVTYSVAPGNGNPATAGQDYVATAGTLVFLPGQTTKTVTVYVRGDIIDEANENFVLWLTKPVGATLTTSTATAVITDDDTGQVTVGAATVIEGNAGKTFLRFPVSMSLLNSRPVVVTYATGNVATASLRATPGSDYVAMLGTLTLVPNQTRTTIDVPVLGDTLDEQDERVALILKQVQGAALGVNAAEGVIRDDDAPVRVSIFDISINEGNRASYATFLVSLSAVSGHPVSVSYTTAPGTATQGSDFTTTSGTLSFAPGETQKRISVPIVGDLVRENNEAFLVKLANLQNAQFARAQATCTLLNDDK